MPHFPPTLSVRRMSRTSSRPVAGLSRNGIAAACAMYAVCWVTIVSRISLRCGAGVKGLCAGVFYRKADGKGRDFVREREIASDAAGTDALPRTLRALAENTTDTAHGGAQLYVSLRG